MKNYLKFTIILFIFILLSIPAIQSFAINMNLESIDIQNNNETNNTNDNINNTTSNNSIDNTQSSNTPKTVTVTSTEDDEFLTVENILSIVIIVIGILLIFLGIAILIRTK